MAYTTIDDPSTYFHTQLYTGDGSTNNAITNDANAGDFKPDWLWIKSRSYSDLHMVFDSSRGRDKRIFPNLTNAEGDSSPDNFLKSFDTDGFTTGNDAGMNTSSGTLVAWQWKANGGTTASNTDGSITSTVQANTTAGFSIVTYTGTGSAGATVGHGLGAVADCLIVKSLDSATNWQFISKPLDSDKFLELNATDGQLSQGTYNMFNSTKPTSTIFTLGNHANTNKSGGESYVAYCFAEKKGYSKFGSYTGNGNADGPMVFCGFKPAWVMIKHTGASEVWRIFDSARDTHNAMEKDLFPNLNNAEGSGTARLDFLSNGFKIRDSGNALNDSGGNLIFMCFASSPFVSSKGVPTTAR